MDLVYDKTFMESFNLSAPTDSILQDLKKFTDWEWKRFQTIFMSWMEQLDVPLALIVTKFGYCVEFNMLTAENFST